MRKTWSLALASLLAPTAASAENARLHALAGAGHAVGGPQSRELGAGGGGGAALELPLGRLVGVQAQGSFFVLAKGRAPLDASVARRDTGSAVLGTVGVRLHPLGAAGLWMDLNGGVAQTGSLVRPAFDAHVGWQGAMSRDARWTAGPFVGYAHVVESGVSFRPDDARVLMLGLSVSLGAPQVSPAPAVVEPPRRTSVPPVVAFEDEEPTAPPDCQGGSARSASGDCVPVPRFAIVEDRIVLDDVIHFDFDSPEVHPISHDLLRHLARFVNERAEVVRVSIEGHADARGTDAYNLALSSARAESTRGLLVKFGVSADRLVTRAHGNSRLKVPTRSPERQNRRVEFVVDTRAVAAAAAAPAAAGAR
jgi:outer membrane protein OmpA-like peptidoglycan-associated protein